MSKLIDALLRPINPAHTALFGVFTVVWGFWIGNPWWSVFDRAPLYRYMHMAAPEWFFGIAATVAGVLIIRGALKPSYRSLTLGATVGFLLWGTVAVFYFIGDWQNTGGVVSAFLALSSGFVGINVSANYHAQRDGSFHV